MSLFVRESGPSDGPSVVLLHGGGVSGWSWDLQLAALREYHVLVPDLPEHGASQDAGPLAIPEAARQVADLIARRAHGGQAHVVGLSLGAQIGLQLLADEPARVCRVILSGTFVLPPGTRSPYQGRVGRTLLAWTVAAYLPLRNVPFLVDLNRRSLGVPAQFTPQMAAETRRLTLAGFMRLIDANQGFALPAGLERAQAPALILAGEKETAVVRRALPLIRGALPQGEACLVPGVGHNWNLEAPERFNAVMLAWLAGRPLPEGLTCLPAK